MKNCPKCNTTHSKPGRFCSRACANSRGPRPDSFKEKVKLKLTGQKRPEKSKEVMGDNNPKRKGKLLPPIQDKNCEYCSGPFRTSAQSRYCSRKCWQEHVKSCKTAWENYKLACAFKFNIYHYPDLFDLSLLEAYGWYAAANKGNNLNGISRDHMISIRYGFENNIDPQIIAHPANCKLVRHKENQEKRTKCSLTLSELTIRITEFNNKYQM